VSQWPVVSEAVLGGALRRPAWFVKGVAPHSGASMDPFDFAWRAQRVKRFWCGSRTYTVQCVSTHVVRVSSVRATRSCIRASCCNLKAAALETEITFILASRGLRPVLYPGVVCRARAPHVVPAFRTHTSFAVLLRRFRRSCAACRASASLAVLLARLPCPCVVCHARAPRSDPVCRAPCVACSARVSREHDRAVEMRASATGFGPGTMHTGPDHAATRASGGRLPILVFIIPQ